ncbi:50S ribosomal protein L25 [bacterium (Candidatus Torokbacteria) CG_4_10_14_0_2_um_filter_35_8]|nr:MAG: 50S ribosomal protein L25 [bacterium (Candidatus Torokbacteria) CG_4_10_14_0_2_um_filter_35_8]
MDNIKLKAQIRGIEKKEKPSILRKKGFLPSVVYGHKAKSLSLKVEIESFKEVYQKAGENSLLELNVEGGGKKHVLIHEVQKDPVTEQILHADFYQVEMKEKIKSFIPLSFVGKSPAVEDVDGVLVKNIDEVEVECFPIDLPKEIKVDISLLRAFGNAITAEDLKVSSKVKVLLKPEEVLVIIQAPRTDEELEELEESVEEKVEEIEGVEKEEGEGQEEGKEEEEGQEEEKTASAQPTQKAE